MPILESAKMLIRKSKGATIVVLDLANQGIDNKDLEELESLIEESGVVHINYLNLESNNIHGGAQVKTLGRLPVTKLNVRRNNITDEGAECIAKNLLVKTLDISHNDLTEAGVRILTSKKQLNLTAINNYRAPSTVEKEPVELNLGQLTAGTQTLFTNSPIITPPKSATNQEITPEGLAKMSKTLIGNLGLLSTDDCKTLLRKLTEELEKNRHLKTLTF